MLPQAVLLFVGDGPDRGAIEQLALESGLDDSVVFAGLATNVVPYLHAMDVFLFPSEYEGFGIAVLEAQAAGLPCVISDVIPGRATPTAYVHRLSLNEKPQLWASTCIEAADEGRAAMANNLAVLQEKGLDISRTTARLENFYESHA